MDYRAAYDMIMDLQEELNLQILEDAMEELKVKPSLRSGLDYKPVKALAATYELQDFLANRIAELVNAGELEPDPGGGAPGDPGLH